MNRVFPIMFFLSIFLAPSAFAQSNTSIFTDEEMEAIYFLLGSEEAASNYAVLLRKNILFDFDRSKVKSNYVLNLDSLAEIIDKNQQLRATVRAYTDTTGGTRYNQKLSQKRANAVKKQLIKYNIPSDMVRAIGYGESTKYNNSTYVGRAKNRRAEIELTKVEGITSPLAVIPREHRKTEEPIEEEQLTNTNYEINNLLGQYNTYCSNLKTEINTYKSCITQKDKPLRACPESEKRDYGIAACAGVMGGCEVASHNVDGFFENQGVAQLCGVTAAEIQGVKYTSTDALKNAAVAAGDDFSDDLIKEGINTLFDKEVDFFSFETLAGAFKASGGFAGRVITTTIKKSDFDKCVINVARECSSIRRVWEQNSNGSCEGSNRELEELNYRYISRCL